MIQSHDFTYKEGDNGEQLSTQVIWSNDSSYNAEASKPIGIFPGCSRSHELDPDRLYSATQS